MINNKKIALIAIFALLGLGACDKINQPNNKESPAASDAGFVQTIPPGEANGNAVSMLLPDFTQLVAQEGAAVVNIQASRSTAAGNVQSGDQNRYPENDPFYEFFKRLLPNMPPVPQESDEGYSFGSGFIISNDGYILTNAHVLNGMSSIKVLLNDKREFAAKLIGMDTQSDVALIKIDADNLPAVHIGNPKDLKVGEWVAAIGAPFGFDNSVTAGIVSAKGRSLPDENYTPFIQTDVAINPGNSGGPLFNLKGQVVGINSQIYSRSGGFMGISFAIPIDVAMNVANQLKTTGKVERGRLGVIIQEVSYDLAKSFGLARASGALISQVLPGSPAAKAGLQVGDIVQSVNGEEVKNSSDLPVMVGILPPGKEVTLSVWRSGKSENIKVVLDGMNLSVADDVPQQAGALAQTQPGFTIEPLGLSLQAVHGGLYIVQSTGIAAKAGLRRGDVIVRVGQILVSNEDEIKKAVQDAGNNIPLLVKRGGNTLFFALSLP
ncbi:DegQ family serine endoprotease [Stenoxybacter acetivorans]|uniref:DegQ family serine endoprotease n=1 Tax=Stenoxybacter acetivorans TaxID=422441 RepID=UPI0009FF0351|nr:DegQ family serine endoprotease [Stenoxybacter acetivorans]